jgi:hypothetical protein
MSPAMVVLTDHERHAEATLLARELRHAGFDQTEVLDCSHPAELATRLGNPAPLFAFPLESNQDGALQGLLEFLGIPYAGPGQTAMVLAADSGYAAAVTGGSPSDPADSPSLRVRVAATGSEQPRLAGLLPDGPLTDAALAERLRSRAADFYRALGLSGWSLLELTVQHPGTDRQQIGLGRVVPWPDLSPDASFRRSLDAAGLDFADSLRQLIEAGKQRFQVEHSLRKHYKDTI